jgi:hypothetical protein
MEEFSALAARVAASVVELRGCLILSRDGLVLGAFPAGEEGPVKTAWLRFAVVGEPEKGFVEFGDEMWTYVRRGPYASFAVSGLGVRPGLLIDQLDQMLYTAEEVRARREALRLPEVTPAPSGKPRTSLHPEARSSVPMPAPVTPPAQATPEATREATPGPAERSPEPSPVAAPSVPPEPAPSRPASAEPPQPTTGSPPPERPSTGPGKKEEDPDVDRVALAQELSKLLQENRGGDENQ